MKKPYIIYLLLLVLPCLNAVIAHAQLAQYNAYKEKIYIQTDHVIYAPGNELYFKIYLVEAATQLPSVVSNIVYADIISPSGNILKTLRLQADNGNAAGSYFFSSEMPGGIYRIRAYTQWMKNEKDHTWFTKEITLQKVISPRVLMKLDFPKKGYGPGDTVTASYAIRNLNNQPIKQFPAKYTVTVTGNTITTGKFVTDTSGKAQLQFTLPGTLHTTDGLLNITVVYDSYTESISRSIPISLHKIHLQLLPEGGTFISGYPASIAFIAVNEYGKPTDVKGVVKDSKGNTCAQLESYHDGMGAFAFTAGADEQYHVELTEPSGIHQHFTLPQARREGVMMHLTVQDSVVRIQLTASAPQQVMLSAGSKNKTVFTRTCNLQPGEQWVNIPASIFQPGITRFTISTLQGLPFAERIAFLHPNKLLNVYITTNKQEYSPREKVTLYVTTLDENNTPIAADFSLSVVDDKLWSLADDKQDHIISWLMMSSELKGKIEEPAFYFKKDEPKSIPALDFVMLTHGYRYFDYSDSVMAHGSTMWLPEYGHVVSGTITDTCGRPVAATVYLVNQEYNSYRSRITEQQTGNNGIFFFTGLPYSRSNLYLIAKSRNKKEPIKIMLEQQHFSNSSGYTRLLESRLKNELPVRAGNQENKTSPRPVTASDKQPPQIEALPTNSNALHDVVVVGYGVTTNRHVLGSVTSILAREFDISSPLSTSLSGRVSGIVVQNNTTVNPSPQLTIRGMASVTGNNEPLWVVDGVPLEKPLQNFNIASITNVTVIKEAAATAIYGYRAMNGVVLVTTLNGFGYHRNHIRLNRKQYYYTTASVSPQQSFDETRQFYVPYYSSTQTKLKTDFRETIYWNPIVQTDSCGEAVVTFYNSDATTTFRAVAEGIGSNGRAGRAEATYTAKPPVSIDAKIPPYLSTGDTAYIPLNVKNNRKDTFLATVQIKLPAALQTGWFDKRVYLLPDSSTQILIPLTATRAIKSRIDITVNNYRDTSTLELPVTALEKGYPVSTVISGKSNVQKTFRITTPAPGSLHARLFLFQNLESQLLDGLESMLAEPHGCFEQTSSATYPNLYILKYLKATGKASPGLEARALKYLRQGYEKLISYETRENGFEWFGNTPASETLTAYGLMEFTDMQEYVEVDKKMLARTKAFLMGRRNRKGGFTIKHNQFHSVPEDVSSLYMVYALTQAGIGNEIQPEYQAAAATALASNDTYQTAMMALAASSMKDTATYNKLMKVLPDTWVKPHSSFVYSRGTSSKVEAAALYALALARAPQPNLTAMSQQMEIILAGKNYFGYGSTQATVLALKAIMAYTMELNKSATQSTVTFQLNNHTIQPDTALDSLVQNGDNQLFVQYSKEQDALPYNLKVNYFSLQPPNSPSAEIRMKTQLQSGRARVGETVRLDISVTNTKDIYQPMTIAKVGIPAGLTLQPWQLKELTERKQVAYYEIFDNYLVLYWMGFADYETKKISLDLKAEIPGNYTGRAGNTYLYYTPEFQYWNEGLRCTILP